MKLSKRTLIIGLIGASLILWGAGSFFFASAPESRYRLATLSYADVVETVSANGTLNPVTLVNVGTEISGKVERLYADFNDPVTSGQALLELNTDLLKSAVAQSKAQLQKAKTALAFALDQCRRSKPLMAKGFVSAEDWDKLVQMTQSTAADVAVAQAQLGENLTSLSKATIRSPLTGTVVNREVDVGQTVAASFQTPTLFTIAEDLTKMQIDTSMAEADIGQIRAGQSVTFTVDAFPDRSFTGVVKQIRLNPAIQQNVVTYNAVIGVTNPDQSLLPGMTAYVNVILSTHPHVLVVPNPALQVRGGELGIDVSKIKKDPGTVVIYRVRPGGTEPVSCRTGATDGRVTEILSGELKEGDSIVTGILSQKSVSSFRPRMF